MHQLATKSRSALRQKNRTEAHQQRLACHPPARKSEGDPPEHDSTGCHMTHRSYFPAQCRTDAHNLEHRMVVVDAVLPAER